MNSAGPCNTTNTAVCMQFTRQSVNGLGPDDEDSSSMDDMKDTEKGAVRCRPLMICLNCN